MYSRIEEMEREIFPSNRFWMPLPNHILFIFISGANPNHTFIFILQLLTLIIHLFILQLLTLIIHLFILQLIIYHTLITFIYIAATDSNFNRFLFLVQLIMLILHLFIFLLIILIHVSYIYLYFSIYP